MKAIKKKYFVFHPLSYGTATLARIGFRTPSGRQLLLHYFPPHEAPTYHDHPWHFRTFILWGGYTDVSTGRYGQLVHDDLRIGSYRFRPALHRHKTIVGRPTFTIVLTGPTEREWCEGTPEHWVCDGDVEDFNATLGMVKI